MQSKDSAGMRTCYLMMRYTVGGTDSQKPPQNMPYVDRIKELFAIGKATNYEHLDREPSSLVKNPQNAQTCTTATELPRVRRRAQREACREGSPICL